MSSREFRRLGRTVGTPATIEIIADAELHQPADRRRNSRLDTAARGLVPVADIVEGEGRDVSNVRPPLGSGAVEVRVDVP